MSSQEFSSEGSDSNDQESFNGSDISSDDSSLGMSEDEIDDNDFFAQLALSEERGTPIIQPKSFSPPQPFEVISTPQPLAQPKPITILSAPKPTLFLSTRQTLPQLLPPPKPTTNLSALPQLLKPTTTLTNRQTLPQLLPPPKPTMVLSTQQNLLQPLVRPKPTIVLSTRQNLLQPLVGSKQASRFPQILTSTGTPIEQIIAPSRPVKTESVNDIIKKNAREEQQRWEYRDKYTRRAETILGNIFKYITNDQMSESFGMTVNQINEISRMNAEQIVAIGQAKTNKLYEQVSYPSELETVIRIIDTRKIS
uniref:Uncharacterized protein n=1 Tax=Pithovirus LCPAC202 TaxID=2506592 RepID=A0A481Z6K8_9VIRU|nr:MAG: hypothetical protein LCPAC202_02200 [Pithovirus LCPAC202]